GEQIEGALFEGVVDRTNVVPDECLFETTELLQVFKLARHIVWCTKEHASHRNVERRNRVEAAEQVFIPSAQALGFFLCFAENQKCAWSQRRNVRVSGCCGLFSE